MRHRREADAQTAPLTSQEVATILLEEDRLRAGGLSDQNTVDTCSDLAADDRTWRNLRSLKLGNGDASGGRPTDDYDPSVRERVDTVGTLPADHQVAIASRPEGQDDHRLSCLSSISGLSSDDGVGSLPSSLPGSTGSLPMPSSPGARQLFSSPGSLQLHPDNTTDWKGLRTVKLPSNEADGGDMKAAHDFENAEGALGLAPSRIEPSGRQSMGRLSRVSDVSGLSSDTNSMRSRGGAPHRFLSSRTRDTRESVLSDIDSIGTSADASATGSVGNLDEDEYADHHANVEGA